MILIEKTDTYGWEAAVRGMRNPMNSWDKLDSYWEMEQDEERSLELEGERLEVNQWNHVFVLGENDLSLMKKLAHSGPDHGKFLRMIGVSVDLTAPFYWWKEFDTYKVGTVANSCSTMHKIQAKEITLNDFSHEHLTPAALAVLETVIHRLNYARNEFNKGREEPDNGMPTAKDYWWDMIQLLPTSYNQKRTVTLNYAVLKNIYHARKNHKLDEWHTFCHWIEGLPYSHLITEQ